MKSIKKIFTLTAVLGALVLSGAEITWFHQDFEDKNFFRPEQTAESGQSQKAGKFTGIISPHGRIIVHNGSQAFQTERIGHHRAFDFSGLTPIPHGRNFSVEVDIGMPEKGRAYFFILGKDGKRIAGISYAVDSALKVMNKKEIWGNADIPVYKGDYKLRLFFDVNECIFDLEWTDASGKKSTVKAIPMINVITPEAIEFGTSPAQGSLAIYDNIKLTYSDHRDINCRKNAAPSAQYQGTNFSGNALTGSAALNAGAGRITLELAKMTTLGSIRFTATDSMQIRVLGLNNGGQRQVLAENDQLVNLGNQVRQADFKPGIFRSIYLECTGKPGDKIGKIGIYEDAAASAGSLSDLFAKDVYGEFDLPVYEGNGKAELHLFNNTKTAIPVQIVLHEQHGKKEYARRKTPLQPGKNVIYFDLKKIPAGYFVADITDFRDQESPVKGSFRRLLRRQVLPEPEITGVAKMNGQKMLFPDDYYLSSCKDISFHTVQAETHKVSKSNTVPELLMQHGLGLYMQDGRLHYPYFVCDNYFKKDSERRFMASASLDDLDNWEISEIPLDTKLPRARHDLLENIAYGDWNEKPGPDGKINYQFYDPAVDGPVNIKQINFKYVHWMTGDTFGGEDEQDWGVIKPERRTTWPIWYKAPGEARILTKTPLFTDNRSGGDFELPEDSNDNFCGQWLSDDGKYVYYCRGHVVRRYPPYNVPYDNLSTGLRLLTICRTKDGINFERSFVSVPGRDEPLQGAQHYGGAQMRLRKANGLRVIFLSRYHANKQQIFTEIAYSWDGFSWKRFAGQPPLAPNGPRGHWMSGSINPGVYSVVTGGKVFYNMTLASNMYHILAELVWDREYKKLDGNYCRIYMQPRGFDKWPLWKDFKDYNDLARHLNNVEINTGIMVWREDGLFYMQAKDTPGSFVTKSLTAGKQMRANLELAENGKAVFTLLDEQNNPIPGFSKTVSGKTDEINLTVFDNIPDGVFKVKGEIINGKLYALSF